ncbi:MAG TPA: hydrolase [Chitinophagales bacterium]|jgi:nicotinamidase-related amidase|nr:hydrolase [Chitinophagales bacterium]
MQTGKLKKEDCLLLVIDIQERLIPVIHQHEEVIHNANILLKGMEILGVPVIVTEQYPKGLGNTCKEILLGEDAKVMEKITFSCLANDYIKESVQSKKQIIICGVEAHICVLKTALDLLDEGYQVHLITDAVSSRKKENKQVAIERMKQSGVFISSTEMILFQLLDKAGTDEFKLISKLIK